MAVLEYVLAGFDCASLLVRLRKLAEQLLGQVLVLGQILIALPNQPYDGSSLRHLPLKRQAEARQRREQSW